MSSIADGLAQSKMTNIHQLHEGDESQSPAPANAPGEAPEPAATSDEQYERVLLQIEHRIRDIGDQLRDHHLQGLKLDHDVEKRKEHEDKRTDLRKQLIEASQEHKDLLAKKDKAYRDRVDKEQQDRIHREKKELQDIEAKVKQAREKHEQELKSRLEASRKEEKQPEEDKQPEEVKQSKQENKEEKPADKTKGLTRIAQIEAELAESRLRESRRRLLDAELASLRVSLSLSPLYSYPLYPYYYPIYPRSYLYPYSSLYRYWY